MEPSAKGLGKLSANFVSPDQILPGREPVAGGVRPSTTEAAGPQGVDRSRPPPLGRPDLHGLRVAQDWPQFPTER